MRESIYLYIHCRLGYLAICPLGHLSLGDVAALRRRGVVVSICDGEPEADFTVLWQLTLSAQITPPRQKPLGSNISFLHFRI